MRPLNLLPVLIALIILPGAVLALPDVPPSINFDPSHFPLPGPRNGNNTTNQTDTAVPVLEILGPRDLSEVKDPGLTVQGTASDESGIRLVSVRLNSADPVQAQGNTSWSIQLKLKEGRNTITVISEDFAGNTASQTISVIYKTEMPGSGGVILAVAVLVLIVVLIALASFRSPRKAPNGNGSGNGNGQGAEPLTKKEEDEQPPAKAGGLHPIEAHRGGLLSDDEQGQIAALDDFDKKKMANPKKRRKDEEE